MADSQPGYKFGKGVQDLGDFGLTKAVKGIGDVQKSKAKQDRDAVVGAHMLTLNHRLDLENKVLDREHKVKTFLDMDKTLDKRNPYGDVRSTSLEDVHVKRSQRMPLDNEAEGKGEEGVQKGNSSVETNLNRYQFPKGSVELNFKEPGSETSSPSSNELLAVFQEPNGDSPQVARPINTQVVNAAVKSVQSRHANAYIKAHQEFYGAGFTPENNPTGHARLQALHTKAKGAFENEDEFKKRIASYPL